MKKGREEQREGGRVGGSQTEFLELKNTISEIKIHPVGPVAE